MTHRSIPASQENKESCNNFIRTMCFAQEYFSIYQYKATQSQSRPIHPLWILLWYTLKLKNNISIHFSVSRYNLTHDMTSLKCNFTKKANTRTVYNGLLQLIYASFSKSEGCYYPVKRAKWTRLVESALGEHLTSKWSPLSGLCTLIILYPPWMPKKAIPFIPASPQSAVCLCYFKWTTCVCDMV